MAMAAGYSSGSDSASELRLAFLSSDKRPRKSPSGQYQPRARIPSVEEVAKKEEPKWTVYSSSQNLAAALNDPMGREPDLFTKTWGGYFIPNASLPSCNIPSIELADFLRYLKETAAGRKSHRAIVRQLKKERKDSESLEASSPVAITPLFRQLKQDGRMYDLSMVPRLFLQEDFMLEDPGTFQEVLPLSQLLPKKKKKAPITEGGDSSPQTPTNSRQTAKLLHEKLTHYLDVVEVHLAYQISQKSDVFFSTLSSQQELQTYIMQVRHNVVELR
jgi:vacuolar protein sorting-associated protein 54